MRLGGRSNRVAAVPQRQRQAWRRARARADLARRHALVDEGTKLKFPAKDGALTHVRVAHFGNFLRVVADLPKGTSAKILFTLTLKE